VTAGNYALCRCSVDDFAIEKFPFISSSLFSFTSQIPN
jgi:hypothetical protein